MTKGANGELPQELQDYAGINKIMKLNPKSSIKIIDEYQALVFPQTEQEYQSLKQSIKENGFWRSHPIVINGEGIILDGHHRFRACQELGIEPRTTIMQFRDKLYEKLFVMDSILIGRRHLNSFQKAEIALNEKPILEEIAKRQMLSGKTLDLNQSRVDTNKDIGRRVGLGKDTIRKVETILQKASSKDLEKAKKGQWSINSAYKRILNFEARDKIINTKSTIKLPHNIKLIHGDFRDCRKEISDNSIDLILTDPPYDRPSLPLYKDLGILAARVLKDGGSLVTIVGHYVLVICANYIEESGLRYIHDFPIIHSGSHAQVYEHDISVMHKPMLWFIKGAKENPHKIMNDVIYSRPPEKILHKWEQSSIEAEHIINGLTVGKNQIVLDPFMGTGTFGRAALKLKRKFIGIDINPETFQLAKANLAKGS